MNITSHRRNDPPVGHDELELHPGQLAQAPIRVRSTGHPVKAVRVLVADAKKAEVEIAKRQAELAAQRAKCIEILDQHATLLATEKDLTRRIAECEGWLEVWQTRRTEINGACGRDLLKLDAETSDEYVRSEFKASRMPAHIADLKKELADLGKRIEKFCAANEITEAD